MKRLYQKIQIGEIGLTGCVSTEITKSRSSFTQTAVITIPNVLYRKKNEASGIANEAQGITSLISRNDVVKIWSGYNKAFDNLPIRFEGFVNRIDVKENIIIYCEDYSYVLKQINVPSIRIKDATIKKVVDHALQGANITVQYDSETIEIGEWVIDNNSNLNAIQVLDKVSKMGIRIYFQDTTLRIGGITDISSETKCFIFEHNIIDNNLIYREDDEVLTIIKGISNLDTNEKIERYAKLVAGEVEISETALNGEQITLNFYNLTAAQLEETITNNFDKYIYKGYSGSFNTFLEPLVKVNDTINLYSLTYPERNGAYKCKSVVSSINDGGGYQNIELDYKISDLNKIGI